ncbi:ATP-binding cassette domain-containing protein [Paenibacillus filicis]|uniref:ATP-binding cassette domain-containing protein n=1 Tax=Paenibacillus filicis TaxID=669464 RepID=A0ABU9DGJ8_9BACL
MSGVSPLHIEQLTTEAGGFRLGPVNLRLEPGLIYALVGPNGSGKSMLLKCCMNLIKTYTGHVSLFGLSSGREEPSVCERVAFSPDPLEGCEPFTLLQMESFIAPWYAAWDHRDFLRRAEQFRLPLKKRYGLLSQGERKKIALTLALSTRAPLLLLDEPTDGLDIASRSRFKQMLVEDADTLERTILLTTHSVEDIRKLADYIVLLKNGQIEGPYEKDALTESWRRFWLSGEALPDIAGIPGVVEYSQSAFPQLVTRDGAATMAYLTGHGIEITKDQPLSLDELLERLLHEQTPMEWKG